jgi:hypothetical protein
VVELDGLWKVERVSGLLPPMVGVRKRIAGDRGETLVGPLPGIPFVVEGHTLRYRPRLSGLVDVVEPDPGGFRGRALLHGREYGRFFLRRIEENGASGGDS